MIYRRPAFASVLTLCAASLVWGGTPSSWVRPAPPEFRAKASAGKPNPKRFLAQFANGYTEGRSGSLFWVGKPGVMFTESVTERNHGSSWDYDVHIPFVLYGPGQIRAVDMKNAAAQSYDVVKTFSALAGIDAPATSQGTAWVQAFAPRRKPVKALMVVVMDQVGYQDMVRYQSYMPTLSQFRKEGADFKEVRNAWLPSVTAMAHAGVGTGACPAQHGVSNNFLLRPDRTGIYDVFKNPAGQIDVSLENIPSFAQHLDEAFDNKPVIISQVYAHYAALAMAGKGRSAPGGDADVVVWYNSKTGKLESDERNFKLPAYMKGRSTHNLIQRHKASIEAQFLSRYPKVLGSMTSAVRATPFFAKWQANNALEMMMKEGVGRDDVPDLVMVNLKSSDATGHKFGHDHIAYPQCLAEIDRFLKASAQLLDARAGKGQWAIAITADHGLAPDDSKRRVMENLVQGLNAKLDGDKDGIGPLVSARAYQIYLNETELQEDGKTLEDVRELLKQDEDILYAWTKDEVAAAKQDDPSAALRIGRAQIGMKAQLSRTRRKVHSHAERSRARFRRGWKGHHARNGSPSLDSLAEQVLRAHPVKY